MIARLAYSAPGERPSWPVVEAAHRTGLYDLDVDQAELEALAVRVGDVLELRADLSAHRYQLQHHQAVERQRRVRRIELRGEFEVLMPATLTEHTSQPRHETREAVEPTILVRARVLQIGRYLAYNPVPRPPRALLKVLAARALSPGELVSVDLLEQVEIVNVLRAAPAPSVLPVKRGVLAGWIPDA